MHLRRKHSQSRLPRQAPPVQLRPLARSSCTFPWPHAGPPHPTLPASQRRRPCHLPPSPTHPSHPTPPTNIGLPPFTCHPLPHPSPPPQPTPAVEGGKVDVGGGVVGNEVLTLLRRPLAVLHTRVGGVLAAGCRQRGGRGGARRGSRWETGQGVEGRATCHAGGTGGPDASPSPRRKRQPAPRPQP